MNFRRAAVVKEGIVGGRVGEGDEHEARPAIARARRGVWGVNGGVGGWKLMLNVARQRFLLQSEAERNYYRSASSTGRFFLVPFSRGHCTVQVNALQTVLTPSHAACLL
mgnify:CR=1 FL=1